MATEFDTKVSLKFREELFVSSDKDLDSFCESLWPVLDSSAREVGQDVGGCFWLDCSNRLTTRYLVVDVTDPEPEKTPHEYRVKISSATKPGYLADVLIGIIALIFMWGLSKFVSPAANTLYIILMAVSLAVGGLLAYLITRPFGKEESASLKLKIENNK